MPHKRSVKRHVVTQPLNESYRLIPLTQGQNAIVDAEDFALLSKWNWYAQWSKCTKSFYAKRHLPTVDGKRPFMMMHREILGCSSIEDGDHKNHDTLDNRRKNLRKCNGTQNRQNCKKQVNNTSGYKGVHFRPTERKWIARIGTGATRVFLGRFSSAKKAALAYDNKAKELYGEFALLNFPMVAHE